MAVADDGEGYRMRYEGTVWEHSVGGGNLRGFGVSGPAL